MPATRLGAHVRGITVSTLVCIIHMYIHMIVHNTCTLMLKIDVLVCPVGYAAMGGSVPA